MKEEYTLITNQAEINNPILEINLRKEVQQWLEENNITYIVSDVATPKELVAARVERNKPAIMRYLIDNPKDNLLNIMHSFARDAEAYHLGHLKITFEKPSDAVLFKLRWYNGE